MDTTGTAVWPVLTYRDAPAAIDFLHEAFGARRAGNDAVCVVCEDPDSLLAQATTAGAEVVRGLADEDYGSRRFTVRDPEGNLWSFGTYGGEQP